MNLEKAIKEANEKAERLSKVFCIFKGTSDDYLVLSKKIIDEGKNSTPKLEVIYSTDHGFAWEKKKTVEESVGVLDDVIVQTPNDLIINLVRPKAENISITDIARLLANNCIAGGYTKKYFSLAERNILFADSVHEFCVIAETPYELRKHLIKCALLYDVSAGYFGNSPVEEFKTYKFKFDDVVLSSFGLSIEICMSPVFKEALDHHEESLFKYLDKPNTLDKFKFYTPVAAYNSYIYNCKEWGLY